MGVEPSRDCKSLSLGSFKVMGMNNLKFAGVAIDNNNNNNNKQQTNKQTNKQRSALLWGDGRSFFSSFFALSREWENRGEVKSKRAKSVMEGDRRDSSFFFPSSHTPYKRKE